MANVMTSRKRRFRAALALSGMTAGQWAAKEDITASYLSAVLAGRESSIRLTGKIDQFIQKHLLSTTALVS